MSHGAKQAIALSASLAALVAPAAAQASRPPLLTLGPDGRVTRSVDDLPADLPRPVGGGTHLRARPARITAHASAGPVATALSKLVAQGRLDKAAAARALTTIQNAWTQRDRMSGMRRSAFGDALSQISWVASHGMLTPERLPLAVLTAHRNAQFWASNASAAEGQRVSFKGSETVWQYYGGHGLQLQMLASFGRANGIFKAKLHAQMKNLLDEMATLAVPRAGGVGWEYAFSWDGGPPHWISAMSQATAAQAYVRGNALLSTHPQRYLELAKGSIAPLAAAPPQGVRVQTAGGPWYIMYSFQPRTFIYNGFLQALIGLDEVRRRTAHPLAESLFAAGEPVARAAIARFTSTGWSFYEPGSWNSASYHELTRGFMAGLCWRAAQKAWCDAEHRYWLMQATPPNIRVTTISVRAGKPAMISFTISKPGTVTASVRSQGRVIRRLQSWYQPGRHAFRVQVPAGRSPLAVSVTATDDSGRTGRATRKITRKAR